MSPERDRWSACVWIDPGRRSGSPCVGGTRVPVDLVVQEVWAGGGVESAMHYWDLTRVQVLNACWFVAAYGVDDVADQLNGKFRRWGRSWTKRWGAWASANHGSLWSADENTPDPPMKERAR